ncbi:MAG: hypothetical protein G01um101448_286 [Parcubacteria group bacterium Gr01-1014_48]|nr:MAG: hypothetical protein Greene041614_604 [Parcubacteria group bacterium Greene0416_14]TSC74176.1 MAG: hypothetical protein G01um101448_286 [Parcubacteria group bacterium Gr01-1014_48]TSD00852.1 MAG: hypothetical protein Greene101415_653 [Parcubacteria group bacterium Greene1014_15]TSD07934.1 MAG: hypothetical protein Greene07144_564 [Parcubacteria group bacterium Greene0714_4]
MAAVISDKYGIFSWGWNHPGPKSEGIHAEKHALMRANRKRLKGAKLTIAGMRKKSKNKVLSRPCDDEEWSCLALACKAGIGIIEYHTKNGEWTKIVLF